MRFPRGLWPVHSAWVKRLLLLFSIGRWSVNMNRNDPIPKRTSGRFAYEGLERLVHEKSRLSILSSLAAHPDGLLFTELKTLCSLTDGNLSRQIQLLQEGGFIEVWKGFRKNRPQTLCRLSDAGRARFLEYIQAL